MMTTPCVEMCRTMLRRTCEVQDITKTLWQTVVQGASRCEAIAQNENTIGTKPLHLRHLRHLRFDQWHLQW